MILFIARKYPPSVGGMQKVSHRLTTEVAKLAESRIIAWGGSQLYLPAFLPYAFFYAVVALARHRYELIHLSDGLLAPMGVLLKLLFRLPVTATVHGLDVIYPNRLYQLVVPRCLNRLDRLLCNSQHTREECLRRGIDAQRCLVIPLGVDAVAPVAREEALRYVEALAGESLAGARIVLTVGRLIRRKGVARFVAEVMPRLVAAVPQVRYLVAGQGPEREAVERAIDARGLRGRVLLLGRVDDKALRMLYSIADLFVMPNLPVAGDVEGFGLVALEAVAYGCWVVAARLEGIQEAVIDGENGFLVEPQDVGQYVAVLSRLLKDDEGRQALGQKARAFTLQNFSWETMARRYYQVFREVANK